MLRAQLPQQGQLGAGTRTDNQRDSPLIRPVFNQLFEQRAHIGHGCQLCEKGSFAATTTIAKRRTDTTHHYLNGYFSEVTLPGRSSTQELQAITPEPVRQAVGGRSEEHTSELQSLMRNSSAVLCLKTQNNKQTKNMNRAHST